MPIKTALQTMRDKNKEVSEIASKSNLHSVVVFFISPAEFMPSRVGYFESYFEAVVYTGFMKQTYGKDGLNLDFLIMIDSKVYCESENFWKKVNSYEVQSI